MKVTFFTNACALYSVEGFRLLADPWLSDTCFEGSWVHDPPIKTRPEDLLDVDALYISHIHPDHADPETLKHFRRDIPIVCLREKYQLCYKHLLKMGFSNIILLDDGQPTLFGPFRLTMFGPFARHPFHNDSCEVGNVVDTALLIDHRGTKVLNCNDNTLTPEASVRMREEHGPITLAQLNYNNAGCYPSCFRNLTRQEKLDEHHRCIERNLHHMAEVARALDARYVQPFAGAYKLGGAQAHKNEYLGTTSAHHAWQYLTKHGFSAIHLAEGESLDLAE